MEKDIISEKECKQKSTGMTGKHHTDETKRKLSEARKGKIVTDETKKKISDSEKGKIVTDETKKKISDAKKGNTNRKGKYHTEGTKEKISESLKGNTNRKGKYHTKGTKEKIKEANKGKKRTDKTKQKMRISKIKYLETIGFTYPNIGRNETKILDDLELKGGYNIIRQFPIGGYFLDGYIPELNLAIEVDEKHHKNQKEKDIQREEFIKKELNCEFLRIKDY